MSAARDNGQASTFIYTNFYNLYRKSKVEAATQQELVKGLVLKSRGLTDMPSRAEVKVISQEQIHELSRWSHAKNVTSHVQSLRDSRKRLNFLMTEIDDILKTEE